MSQSPSCRWPPLLSSPCRSSASVWPQRSSWETQIQQEHSGLQEDLHQTQSQTHSRTVTPQGGSSVYFRTRRCLCGGALTRHPLAFPSSVSLQVWLFGDSRLANNWLSDGELCTDRLRRHHFAAGRRSRRWLDVRLFKRHDIKDSLIYNLSP